MVILFQPLLGYAKDFMSEVARANELHANNNFQEAADAYESIHEAGLENGYLYYNLGNTYIRLGKNGFAILNYIRALKLIPRYENLQANLNFAIQQTRDKIPLPKQSALNTLFFWVSDLNLSENLKIAFLVNKPFKTPVKSAFLADIIISFKSESAALFNAILIPFFSISFFELLIPAVSETITG